MGNLFILFIFLKKRGWALREGIEDKGGDEQRAVLAQMSTYNSFFSVLRNRGISDATDIRRG
jgi:hypothetical protein